MSKEHGGRIIIFTSPSGAGKTTLVRHLLSKYKDRLGFSVSATTRKRRNGEEDGVHYYFLSEEAFLEHIRNHKFIESEEVYPGLYYGTLHSEVDRLSELGKNLVLDIDVKGAQNVKNLYGDQVLSVFVKPPSPEILIERLKQRGTESEEELNKRIERMQFELSHEDYFDAIIVNDALEDALKEAERLVEGFLGIRSEHTTF
jgi:guanylate kinase